MTDRLITDAELEELTGFKRGAQQADALRRHGLRPFMRPDGKPRVTIAAVTQACIAGEKRVEPNFDALIALTNAKKSPKVVGE